MVGDAVDSVVEDVVVGRDRGLVEGVGGDRSLGDRRLGEDALAGAAGVEFVGREDSADFEWFEHVFLLGWAVKWAGAASGFRRLAAPDVKKMAYIYCRRLVGVTMPTLFGLVCWG